VCKLAQQKESRLLINLVQNKQIKDVYALIDFYGEFDLFKGSVPAIQIKPINSTFLLKPGLFQVKIKLSILTESAARTFLIASASLLMGLKDRIKAVSTFIDVQ
jgi:NifU-like protein involved in Fe-S cluster formation